MDGSANPHRTDGKACYAQGMYARHVPTTSENGYPSSRRTYVQPHKLREYYEHPQPTETIAHMRTEILAAA